MADKPIIRIDVDDSAFQKFLAAFENYSAQLDAMPESWKALNDAMGGAGETLEAKSLSAKDALALAAAQASVMADALRDAVDAQQEFGRKTNDSNKGMTALAKTAKGLGKSIFEMGVTLAKLGAVGLGLGALGSGFGFADLAGAVLSRSRESGALGISPGELASFKVNAQAFLTTAALQNAVSAQTDITKAGSLSILGIDYRKARTQSASDLAFDELKAARAAYISAQRQGLSPMQSPAVQAYQALGGDVGDIRNSLQYSLAQINAAQRATRADAGDLGFDRGTRDKWIMLQKALDRAGNAIETQLIRSLADLAPQIARLSGEVVRFIQTFLTGPKVDKFLHDLGDELHWLADYMGKPEFKKNVQLFGDSVGQLASEVVSALRFFHLIPDGPPSSTDPTTGKPKDAGASPYSVVGSVLGKIWDFSQADARFQIGLAVKAWQGLTGAAKTLGAASSSAWHFLTSPIAASASAAVLDVAKEKGVDPVLALAVAQQESGLNPTSKGDFDKRGQPTSFGLYQLHRGGELGALTAAQAFDPRTNARVALSEFAAVMHMSAKELRARERGLGVAGWSDDLRKLTPGQIAALAQRPADPVAYARGVDAKYTALAREYQRMAEHKTDHHATKTVNHQILKALKTRQVVQPAKVSISNSTSARVAVSANAVALA